MTGCALLAACAASAMPTKKELAAAKAFSTHFAGIERPGVNAANAEFKLADAYRHQGDALRKAVKDTSNDKKIAACYAQATKIYNALASELAKPDSKYVTASTERKTADQLLEGALFQRGVCIQRLPFGGDRRTDCGIGGPLDL